MNPFYLSEHLTADYKEVFEQAVLYGSNQKLNEQDFEAALLNLYDLLYTAQTEGKPVQDLMKTNINSFCQAYFDGLEVHRILKQWPKLVWQSTKTLLIIEGIIFALDWLAGTKAPEINLAYYAYGMGIAFLMNALVKWIYQLVKGHQAFRAKYFYAFCLAMILLSILLSVQLGKSFPLMAPRLWVLPIALGIFCLLSLFQGIKNQKTYGQWTNPEERAAKREKKTLNKQMSEQVFDKAYAREYKKKVIKSLAKGKSLETIVSKIQKDIRLEERLFPLLPWLAGLIYLFFIAIEINNSTPMDLLIYMVLQGSIQGTWWIWFRKFFIKSHAQRQLFLQELMANQDRLDDFLAE